MNTIEGQFFDGYSSKASTALCIIEGEQIFIYVAGQLVQNQFFKDCSLSPKLGKTRRSLSFANQSRFDTNEVAAFDVFDKKNQGLNLVHRLESNWPAVLASIVVLILAVWTFTAQGIPFLAKQAAFATPLNVLESLSQKTLAFLDKDLFEPSALEPDRQAELREGFKAIAASLGTSYHYRLEFRSSELGANAFALPSGQVVMTDDLVALAEDDKEILSVLAHEIAHVEYRHGLRSIYQGLGVFFLISVIAGDVTSVTSLSSTLPAYLIDNGFSRRFETQADTLSANYTLAQGWGTEPLRTMLARLEQSLGGSHIPDFLVSHPSTPKRLLHLEELERNYKTDP